jgi:hypothetical protein
MSRQRRRHEPLEPATVTISDLKRRFRERLDFILRTFRGNPDARSAESIEAERAALRSESPLAQTVDEARTALEQSLQRTRWLEAFVDPSVLPDADHDQHGHGGCFLAWVELLVADVDELAGAAAADLYATAERLIRPELLNAALASVDVTNRWPWPHDVRHPAGLRVRFLYDISADLSREAIKQAGYVEGTGLNYWPGEAAPRRVFEWAQALVGAEAVGASDTTMPRLFRFPRAHDDQAVMPSYALALLYLAEERVQESRRRPVIAIDSSPEHHEFLTGLIALPRRAVHTIRAREAYSRGESVTPSDHVLAAEPPRLMLMDRGKCVQLALTIMDPDTSVSEIMMRTLSQLRGHKGLRHWMALQRLFAVEGGRTGTVLWTLDAHLEALQYSPKERTRASLRKVNAEEVRSLSELELATFNKDQTLRSRKALIQVLDEIDKRDKNKWLLSAMELQINPRLYRGVRDMETGEIGSNWYPTDVRVAGINHKLHPYALTLGAILPIRWRLAWSDGRDYIDLSGENLLRTAGLDCKTKFYKQHPGRIWTDIERNLERLREADGLGRWEWTRGKHTMAGICRLWPADWMLTRTVYKVAPLELPPGPVIMCGDDLRQWRESRKGPKGRKMTQAEAAEIIGVDRTTIARAELAGTGFLSSRIKDGLMRARLL